MATHPKNNLYVKKWRENNKQLNNERACMYSRKYADFKRQQRILFNIDITFFY
jgi:hypothetical protein